MTTELLNPGSYQLPTDCKAFVRGGVVYVCKKFVTQQYPRCRDCAHFQKGTAMYNQFNQTNICVKKPKDNKGYPLMRQQWHRKGIMPQTHTLAPVICTNLKPSNNGTSNTLHLLSLRQLRRVCQARGV